MPELPEAETIRKGLNKTVKGKRIKNIIIFLPKMVRRHSSKQELIRRIRGKKILNIKRRGKALLFILDSTDVLIFRLGMTGQMLWSHPRSPLRRDKHTHVIIDFSKGERILFRDIRQFGEVCLVKKEHVEETLNMGAEPLNRAFTHETLKKITSSPVKIKNLLMDQKRIAGIGNIYSDEILFEAGIHPLKSGYLLRSRELKKLHRTIGSILNEAIACKGDTISQYRNVFGESGQYQNFHRVYQRKGENCHKCSTPIKRIKLSGRSCHYCPSCQKS
jgi:formamidopyrimidine-DNA glycosylase